MYLLKKLRNNPKKTIESSFIFLDSAITGNDGCRVEISESYKDNVNVLSITPSENSKDYFFPYIQANAGHVSVQPEDGTIVLTPPMNGCALEVRYFHNNYIFYHDANGKNMDKVECKGVLCCRIEAKDYWDDSYAKYPEIALPAVQFVCVYYGQKWYVGAFGIQYKPTGNGKHEACDVFIPINGRYRGCFSCTQFLTNEIG